MMSRRSIMLIGPICVVVTSAVAGCVSGRVRQIYMLSDPADTPMDHESAAGRTSGSSSCSSNACWFRTISIRPTFISRVGAHELHASSSGRWGERLSLGIMHALWADLASRLPQDRVMLARPRERFARQILVNVDAFDVWPSGRCVLAANWTILDTERTGSPHRRPRHVHRAVRSQCQIERWRGCLDHGRGAQTACR